MKTYQNNNFFLIAGPCVIESREMTLEIARYLAALTEQLEIHFFFKASFKKANRSSLYSFTGIGDEQALEILKEVKTELNVPIVTDIHTVEDAEKAAQVADVLQIPAFLCRQTELIQAAAKTGKVVNIKKGQFLSPVAMRHAVEKVRATGNPQVMLTERGTTFGYQDLIVDFRGIHEMKTNDCPVVMDCTHSLQIPNLEGGVTGGMPQYIETIARAAVATGYDGLFMETHPDPKNALSDGANMLPLDQMQGLLERLLKIRNAIM